MRVETKRERIVIKERLVYIADDGLEFDSKAACEHHEKELEKEYLTRQVLEKIEYCKNAEGHLPFDGGVYEESHDYSWYKPKNSYDIEVLNKLFEIHLSDSYIGDWICIENANWGDNYYTSLSDSIDYAKNMLAFFGYKMIVEKTEN